MCVFVRECDNAQSLPRLGCSTETCYCFCVGCVVITFFFVKSVQILLVIEV